MIPPPDSDLDDEQIRALLASPLYLQEREANAERSQVLKTSTGFFGSNEPFIRFQETGSNYSDDFLTFQLIDSRSKSSIYVEPRPKHAT